MKFTIAKAVVDVPPPIITYQGKLLDAGAPVDGTVGMGFLIYDAETDGSILYTASGTTGATSTVDVEVTDSIFSINLGEGDTNDIDTTIFQSGAMYLEVWIGDTALSPRKLLTTAPYAFNSKYLMGYGVATASTSEYIPRSNASGNFTFTGDPASSDVSGGTVYINPASAGAGETIFGVAVGGAERFRVDKNGNAWIVGALTATGTAQSAFTELLVTNGNGITLGGVRRTSWPAEGGSGDVVASANNTFTKENTFTATSTLSGQTNFDGLTYFSQTADMQDLVVGGGITLGGVERTTWPDAGGAGDVVAADDNIFTGENTFNSTSTFDGLVSFASTSQFVGTSTMENLVVNNSITLGGEQWTSWPNFGYGDVIAADNNGFLGVNTFSSTSTFDGPVSFTSSTYFTSTSTMDDLIVSNSITLGGVERTTWPAGGGSGDVVAADDNTLTGENMFTATTTLATSTISELNISNGITLGGVRHVSWPGGVAAGDDNTFTGDNTFNGASIFNGLNSEPTFHGWLGGSGSLDGLTGIVVSGQYAYALSYDIDTFVVLDMSDKTSPVVLSTLTDASLNGPQSLTIQGDYAYVVSKIGSTLAVIDISDPTNPVLASSGTYGLSSPESIAVSGNYLYIPSGGNDKLIVVDVSNPYAPIAYGSISNGGSVLLDNPKDVVISGKYAYVAVHDSGAMTVIDVSDPSVPAWVSSVDAGMFLMSGARTIATFGKYVYVGCDVSNNINIIDVSDPTTPTYVSIFNRGGSLDDVYSLFATRDYLYMYGVLIEGVMDDTGIAVVDVRTPAAPTLLGMQSAAGGDTSNGPRSLSIQGNFAYITSHSYVQGGGGGDEMYVYDITGATISNADIGNANVSNLSVLGDTILDGSLSIREGLSVGNSGFLLNGDFGMFAPTSSLSATNTLNFSHTALFRSSASTTEDHVFIFDTTNSITSGGSNYLLSIRNNGTAKFSVATNGDTRAAGTLYAANNVVGTPGTPGDLAERVDIAFDDEVEPGDVVVVDPNNTDTYRRSSSAYMQEVSGVISTNPTIVVGDGKTENTAVMAMVGRVPIKVSNENGPVVRGDLLVTASKKGYAMRYDQSKDVSGHIASVVGVALEGLVGDSGKIMGLVRTGWVDGGAQDLSEIREELGRLALAQSNMSLGPGVSVEEKSDGTIGSVETDFSLNGFSLLAVKSVHGENDKWAIDEQGRFITTVETSEGEKTLYALQTGESQYVFSGNARLVDGRVTIEFDPAVQDIIDTSKPMSINLTLTAQANGIFVSRRAGTGFDVEEMNAGSSNATFDWLVFATRKGEGNDEVVTSTPEESLVVEENASDDVPTSTPTPEQEVLTPEDEVSPAPVEPVDAEAPVDALVVESEPVVDPVETPLEEISPEPSVEPVVSDPVPEVIPAQ